MQKPDALIFDMDGTLWDAVDTYVWCWNEAFRKSGLPNRLERKDLIGLMGTPIDKIIETVTPGMTKEKRTEFEELIKVTEEKYGRDLGGTLYPGVKEGIARLAGKYPLMLLSNCEKGSLPLFLEITGLRPYFQDDLCYGDTHLQKSGNLRILCDRHQLQHAVYIGDTDGDSHQTHLAGMPFFFVRYGFGETEHYTRAFDSFCELTDFFMNMEDE